MKSAIKVVLQRLKKASRIKCVILGVSILLVVVIVVQYVFTGWFYLGTVSAISTFLITKDEDKTKECSCAWAIRKVGIQGELTEEYNTGSEVTGAVGNVGEYDATVKDITKMNDVTILARLISAEAGSVGFTGSAEISKLDSLMVAAVALNRTKIGYSPWSTLVKVVTARNQYSTYPTKFYNTTPTAEEILSAKQVLSGLFPLATAVVFQSTTKRDLGENFLNLVPQRGNKYAYHPSMGSRTKDAFGNTAKTADELRQISKQLLGNSTSLGSSSGETTETTTQSSTQSTSQGAINTGYTGTAGQDSGLFSNLLTDASKHKSEYWYSLVNDVGKPPNATDMSAKQYSGSKAFKYNKQGNALYAQSKSKGGSVSTYSTQTYNGGNTFGAAGCGICSLAMTLTSLSGKVVNPAEITVAAHTYSDRHAGGVAIFSGVITGQGIVNLAKDAGFKADRFTSYTQSTIDTALDQGAYIIYATKNSVWGWGSGNHYITITDKDSSGGYHIIDSANIWRRSSEQPFEQGASFEKIKQSDTGQGIEIIYPRTDLLGELNTITAPTGQKLQTGVRYIMYHTGNPNCEMHSGVYCSCGLDAAYDSTKEYELYDEMTGSLSVNASETGSTGATNGSIGTSTYKATPGKFQGIWGSKTTEQILNESPVHGGKNLNISHIQKYAGTANAYFNSGYRKGQNTAYGVPYFAQGAISESWTGHLSLENGSEGSNSLYSSGCAVYMWASITSKLTGKLINPPEMLGLMHHYGVLNSAGEYKADSYGINDLMGLIGYKVEYYTGSTVTSTAWAKADAALAQGIPQGFRTSTPSSHYFVITSKTSDGKYILYQGSGIVADTKAWTREALQGLMYSGRPSFFVVTRK